jgi:hypothetical protein
MGQAKKRGTFEERKAAAIEDNRKTIQLLREREEAWWNSLTPEEQEAVAKKRVERMYAMAALSKWTAAANGGYRQNLLDGIKVSNTGCVSFR